MNFLKDIRVGKKIGGGFGAVLALLLVIGGVGFMSVQDVGVMFSDYRGLARQTNQYGRVQANLLMVRMGVKDFIIRGDQKAIDMVRQRAKTTEEVIIGAHKLTSDESEIAYIAEMEDDLVGYQGGFDKVVALQADRNKLVATLDDLGPQMERSLTEIMQSAYNEGDPESAMETAYVLRDLLLARLYVTKFLLSNDPAAYDRAKKEFGAFADEAETMMADLQNPGRKAMATDVSNLAETYTKTFVTVYRTINDRNAIISGTLDVLGPEVANDIESKKLEIKGLQDELGPQAVASINRTQMIVAIVAIVAVVLGIATAYLIGNGIIRPTRGAVDRLAVTSAEIAASADQLEKISSQQSASVTETTATMGELDVSAKRVAEQSGAAAGQAEKGVALSGEGKTAAEDLHAAMSDIVAKTEAIGREILQLGEQTGEIGSINAAVTDIANQTNLLALNAAVEAARAGEHGQGFAVVAQEIRKLAEQSKKSAERISRLVGDIQEVTNRAVMASENGSKAAEEGARKVEDTGRTFESVAEAIGSISVVIGQIAKNAEEQSNATKQVSEAMSSVNSSIRETTDGMGQVRAGVENLDGVARSLQAMI